MYVQNSGPKFYHYRHFKKEKRCSLNFCNDYSYLPYSRPRSLNIMHLPVKFVNMSMRFMSICIDRVAHEPSLSY